MDTVLDQCWASVADADPTLNQHGSISPVSLSIATVGWDQGGNATYICTCQQDTQIQVH